MPQSLAALERQRAAILSEILHLGDFRSGSITATRGRCGKPNCRCHQPDQPPHGPHFRLTKKVSGKTVTETLLFARGSPQGRTPGGRVSSLPTTQPAIARCQRKHLPSATRRRHPEAPGKKTAETIRHEVAQEVTQLLGVIFRGQRRGDPLDLEAVETAVRGTMHRAGTTLLSKLLSSSETVPSRIPCPCGQQACYRDTRPKQLTTVVGEVRFERAYYLCSTCRRGQSPRDRELDIEGTACSPGVRRMMALVGSETSFEQGREQLDVLAGLDVTAKSVERHAEALGADIEAREQVAIQRAKQLDLPHVAAPAVPLLYIEMDGTGIPVVAAETAGRVGKTAGRPARTREVKLGCVFTQTTTDEQGRLRRDENSTSYSAAIEGAEAFGLRLYTEAWRRGWSRARKKVILGDGAPWIWNLAHQHFPGAVEIVDLYHARQHLWELSAKLFPSDERRRKRWAARLLHKLEQGKIKALVKVLRGFSTPNQESAHLLANEADYFERNAERMRYPEFRRQGLFVGSGVVEAGCKKVIGARLKRSGMFWTVRGANAIIALRCCRLSGRFEDYWEARARAA